MIMKRKRKIALYMNYKYSAFLTREKEEKLKRNKNFETIIRNKRTDEILMKTIRKISLSINYEPTICN